jgi:hypothetical protein
MMTDNTQFQQVQEASWDVVNSYRETSQAFADRILAIQELNLRFAQNIFLSWMELLTQQTESTGTMGQQWGQQTQKRQDAFQRLIPASMQLYMNFFLAPFTLSRKLVEASMPAMQREPEMVP